jgi:hypothetical protein
MLSATLTPKRLKEVVRSFNAGLDNIRDHNKEIVSWNLNRITREYEHDSKGLKSYYLLCLKCVYERLCAEDYPKSSHKKGRGRLNEIQKKSMLIVYRTILSNLRKIDPQCAKEIHSLVNNIYSSSNNINRSVSFMKRRLRLGANHRGKESKRFHEIAKRARVPNLVAYRNKMLCRCESALLNFNEKELIQIDGKDYVNKSRAEKEKLLRPIFYSLAIKLGVGASIPFEVRDDPKDLLTNGGLCVDVKGNMSIFVNVARDQYKKEAGPETIFTLFHELRHVLQLKLGQKYSEKKISKEDPNYELARFFATAYKGFVGNPDHAEMKFFKGRKNNKAAYQLYFNSLLEEDARFFQMISRFALSRVYEEIELDQKNQETASSSTKMPIPSKTSSSSPSKEGVRSQTKK